MSKTLSQVIGNIKRTYTNEDFNPFTAMEFIYDQCLAVGVGKTVTLVGHSERYKNEMVRAWHHVLASRNLISGNVPPMPDRDGYVETHTGTILRFLGMEDTQEGQVALDNACTLSSSVVLCSKYQHPNLRSVIRGFMDTINIYDVSGNNLKKDVDSE